MPLNPAPIQAPANSGGVFSQIWVKWFTALRGEMHVAPSYTVAQLPTTLNAGALAFVTNETGGAVLAFYDGANWRRCTDRAIVS